MTPRLSILLATVLSRQNLFAKLLLHLQAQAEGKPVELVIACDNKEISIGKKRQQLLERATGDYVCFVDDDDWVSDDYVDRILAAIETNPDCVGFLITCTTNGRDPKKAIASLKYRQWADNVDGYHYVRSPYHKTPVRREIALKAGFPDLRYAEDKIYSNGILKHLKTEVFVSQVLYQYRYRNEPFNQKYGIVTKTVDYKGRKLR